MRNLASIICIRTLYASLTTYMLTTDKCLIQQKNHRIYDGSFIEYFIIYVSIDLFFSLLLAQYLLTYVNADSWQVDWPCKFQLAHLHNIHLFVKISSSIAVFYLQIT